LNKDMALKKERFLFGANKETLVNALAAARDFKEKQKQFKKQVSSLLNGVSLFSLY